MSAGPPQPRPRAARRRGQPILVLLAIVGGWVGVRAATWDGGWDLSVWPQGGKGGLVSFGLADHAGDPLPSVGRVSPPTGALVFTPPRAVRFGRAILPAPLPPNLAMPGIIRSSEPGLGAPPITPPLPSPEPALTPPRAAPMLEAPSAPTRPAPLPRWSADGWFFARQGGGGRSGVPGGTLLLPSYGANQVGAVLRYRLAPTSGFGPTVYGRAYSALNGTGEREVALGFSARPVPALPVAALVEGRVSRFSSGITRLRPAVTLVTEIPPVMLPLALRAESYVQAGYVAGLGATPFVDGQFRLEHVADHHARSELRLGGGIWGGAQRGAGRLDVGPGATVAFATGRAGAHLSLDWRFRVAGSAMPGSGPTVTLAAGF